METWKGKLLGVAAAVALALVASCDNGPSAVETRDRSAEAPTSGRDYARAERSESSRDRGQDERGASRRAANDDAPDFRGRPLWSSNRRYSAVENADYHFRRNGRDFDADTVDAYVAKAHDFIRKPPRGTLTLTRANGDRLLYDPSDNVFAVATREGAPRTMFKPDDGMAYWERQIAREAGEGGERRRAG